MNKEIIILDNYQDDSGKYELKFHNSSVNYKGVDYKYHSSGLCRIVYVDPGKKFVLKIPNRDLYDSETYNFDPTNLLSWTELPWSVRHNFLEYWAYQQCPKKLRKWFAKTELLEFGWLKQEFVEVFDVNISHRFREAGRKLNGQVCLFDFDPLISHDDDPIPERLERSYLRIIKQLKSNKVILNSRVEEIK